MVRALGRSEFPKFGPHISRTKKKEKHAHMDTLFLLSSACLLPITEVCREGPHDWFTGCKEDKQVYGLANICQGWISLKPEPKGKRRSRKEKSRKQTHWKYCALLQQWWKVRWDVPVHCHLFLWSHLLLHNGIIIKRNLVNLPRSPAPRVEINVAQPWSLGLLKLPQQWHPEQSLLKEQLPDRQRTRCQHNPHNAA